MAGMQPIRWDNVGGGGIAEASAPMLNAANLFNNAISGLQGAVKDTENVGQANWQNQKANNTTEFLNGLYSKYTNADDLNAAIKNGDIAKQLSGYGYQIDSGAVRGAADARMQSLMQQATQKISYDHAMTDERTAKALDDAHAAAYKGDQAGFTDAMARYTAGGGRDIAGALAFKDQRDRQLVERSHTDRASNDLHSKTLSDITTSMINARANQTSAQAAASNAVTNAGELGLRNKQFGLTLQDHIQQQESAARQQLGSLYGLDPRSGEGAKLIADELDKTKDAGLSDNQKRVYQTMLADPKATTGGILAAIRGMNTVWYKPDFMSRGNAVDLGNQISQSDAATNQLKNTEAQKGHLLNRLGALATDYAQAQSAYPISGAPGAAGGLPAVLAGARERPLGPSSTATSPGSVIQQAALAAQMDRDPAVQATQAASRRISTDAAAGNYGPHGYTGDASTPKTAYTPPPIAQTVGNDPKVKALQDKLASINSKDKLTADDIFAKRDVEANLRVALKNAQDKALSDSRSASLKRLDLNSIINQSAFPPPVIR